MERPGICRGRLLVVPFPGVSLRQQAMGLAITGIGQNQILQAAAMLQRVISATGPGQMLHQASRLTLAPLLLAGGKLGHHGRTLLPLAGCQEGPRQGVAGAVQPGIQSQDTTEIDSGRLVMAVTSLDEPALEIQERFIGQSPQRFIQDSQSAIETAQMQQSLGQFQGHIGAPWRQFHAPGQGRHGTLVPTGIEEMQTVAVSGIGIPGAQAEGPLQVRLGQIGTAARLEKRPGLPGVDTVGGMPIGQADEEIGRLGDTTRAAAQIGEGNPRLLQSGLGLDSGNQVALRGGPVTRGGSPARRRQVRSPSRRGCHLLARRAAAARRQQESQSHRRPQRPSSHHHWNLPGRARLSHH